MRACLYGYAILCYVMISCDAPRQYDRPALPTQHTQRRSAPTKSVRMARGGEGRERTGNGTGE